jgi:hypothetical protein
MTKILMRKEINSNVVRRQSIELMKLTGWTYTMHEKQILIFFVAFVTSVEEIFVRRLLYVFGTIPEV